MNEQINVSDYLRSYLIWINREFNKAMLNEFLMFVLADEASFNNFGQSITIVGDGSFCWFEKWVWPENATITYYRLSHGTARKSQRTIYDNNDMIFRTQQK